MLKKIISCLMTLLAALLLASCAPSHSTNNQPTASSAEVAKKNEISITISVTPEGQKAQSKTLKVAEESNLLKVLKANYKIEEKNGMITFFLEEELVCLTRLVFELLASEVFSSLFPPQAPRKRLAVKARAAREMIFLFFITEPLFCNI